MGNLKIKILVDTTQTMNMEASNSLNTIEEIGIVIAAVDLTPTMMSQDFLRFSGIIPKDWELSQQPVLNPSNAQLNYTNGVSITAQPQTVTLSEALNNKGLEDVVVPEVALRYVEKLPHADYLGMSFSPKILVPFPQNPEVVRQYIVGNLLGSGSWKKIGTAPVQASVNLMYTLERCQLSISVAEARLQQQEQAAVAAILFSGSFNYNISQNIGTKEKLDLLKQALGFWKTDLNKYREIVMNQFLNVSASQNSAIEESVFPGL